MGRTGSDAPKPVAAGGMILAAVLAGSWSLRSVSEDSAARIARTGVVRIGYAVEPPFALVAPQGRVTGESPEVARAVWRTAWPFRRQASNSWLISTPTWNGPCRFTTPP